MARFLVLLLVIPMPWESQARDPGAVLALPQSAMAFLSNRFGPASDRKFSLQLGIEGHWLLSESLNPDAPGADDFVARNAVNPSTLRAGDVARPNGALATSQQRLAFAVRSGCPGRLRQLFGATGVAARAIEWRIGNRCVSDWHPVGESQLQAIQRLAWNLRAEGFAASTSGPRSLAGRISTFHRDIRGYAAQIWVHCSQKTCRVFASETTLL